MNGGEVFIDVVAKIFWARAPTMTQLLLSGPESEPVEELRHMCARL